MEESMNAFWILRKAVQELYYAAVWHADRPVDEIALWTAVRDAAGFEHGQITCYASPAPTHQRLL